jgi:exodeoxyribonuclease-3
MLELSLLTLNIANPSPERAERQLGWLAARHEDVLVLTETKDSAGCRLLADAFGAAGYHVSCPKPDNGDYGVMIASRIQAYTGDFGDGVGYLPSRVAAVTLPAPSGPIQVIGAYRRAAFRPARVVSPASSRTCWMPLTCGLVSPY